MASVTPREALAAVLPTLLQPMQPGAHATDYDAVGGVVRASLLAEAYRCMEALKHTEEAPKNMRMRDFTSACLVSLVLAVDSGAYGDPADVIDLKPALRRVCAMQYKNMRRVGPWREAIKKLRERIGDMDDEEIRDLLAAIDAVAAEMRVDPPRRESRATPQRAPDQATQCAKSVMRLARPGSATPDPAAGLITTRRRRAGSYRRAGRDVRGRRAVAGAH